MSTHNVVGDVSAYTERQRCVVSETLPICSTLMHTVEIHTATTAGQLCTVEAGLIAMPEEMIATRKFGLLQACGPLTLADTRGVIQCVLWDAVAHSHWTALVRKYDQSVEHGKVAFYRISDLTVMEPSAPTLTPWKRLRSTERTRLTFMGMQSHKIRPHPAMFLQDFTSLEKQIPHVSCLQGIVVEPWSRHQANNAMEMCTFQLVSRDGIAVSCVAFGANAVWPFLKPNVQIAVFGALALDDRENPNSGKGALWVYDNAHIMMTGAVERSPLVVRILKLQ